MRYRMFMSLGVAIAALSGGCGDDDASSSPVCASCTDGGVGGGVGPRSCRAPAAPPLSDYP